MKKYILSSYIIFLILTFWGCEKKFDGTVDPQAAAYNISGINSFSNFNYVVGDSLITLQVIFSNDDGVTAVSGDVYASDGVKLNNSPVYLLDNGRLENGDVTAKDNTYSAVFPLKQSYPNGSYTIKYFITDSKSTIKQVAAQTFNYDNGQANAAPVISNLQMPDSVSRGTSFTFMVTANDSNGLNDIAGVIFMLYRPDGTVVEEAPGDTIFSMHDDGNLEVFGDAAAGDGIYSFKNSFSASTTIGIWRFEILAVDRRNVLSNKITHNIVVK